MQIYHPNKLQLVIPLTPELFITVCFQLRLCIHPHKTSVQCVQRCSMCNAYGGKGRSLKRHDSSCSAYLMKKKRSNMLHPVSKFIISVLQLNEP